MRPLQFFLTTSILISFPQLIHAVEPVWKDKMVSTDVRTKALLHEMTEQEKLRLIMSDYAAGTSKKHSIPKGAIGSAGYVPPIERLGIPAQQITDAGLGITNPNNIRPNDGATGLPSGQAIAGTFSFDLIEKAGEVVGQEAANRGFNVVLGGGNVLVRDPRNGRNFEYLGEDPLLAGNMVAAFVQGVQSKHVLSTVKHYAFATIETNRTKNDMRIDEQPARESDLLAFEIAVKQGDPAAILCAYNKVNGEYSCENDYLLQLPKRSWGYQGYILSEWGGVHSTVKSANAGLDQESGVEFDRKAYFGKDFKKALAKGEISQERLNDMAYRILHSMIQVGAYDYPTSPMNKSDDVVANEAVSQTIAEEGSVLLKNKNNILPLNTAQYKNIAIIGGHADKGVLSGGGSSQVTPRGGNAVPNQGPQNWPGPIVYFPSSPMKEIQALDPKANVQFAAGDNINNAVDLAKKSDIAIVFATKWSAESFDNHDLKLPNNQDQLIEAVAKTGKPVIVVLETGNPVEMPWLNNVDAVLEAWYPGTSGGKAIANILLGVVNPSGKLTQTWPKALNQSPYYSAIQVNDGVSADRSKVRQYSDDGQIPSTLDLNRDGANVGYRWYEANRLAPLFPFGYGLSYTTFKYKKIKVEKNFVGDVHDINAVVTVENTGDRDGVDVLQIYGSMPDGSPKRLLGFRRVHLKAGEKQKVVVPLFPAMLSHYNIQEKDWVIQPGNYEIYALPDAFSGNGVKAPLKIDERITLEN